MNIAKHIDKFTADELKEMAQWLEYNPGGPYRRQYGNVGLVAFAPLDELLRIYGSLHFIYVNNDMAQDIRKKLKGHKILRKLKEIKEARE